ncbi:MAG: flagellar assembly protein FliW [Candidatus Eiseniibacteriota bacterium]
MRIKTRSLGEVEATPESFITLPEGLLGYEEQREFVLVSPTEFAPFRWLLSFSDPELAFPVLDAHLVSAEYKPQIPTSDRRALGAAESDLIDLLVLASVDPSTGKLTVNLRAPIALSAERRIARQVVLSDGRWTVDHPVSGSGHGQDARKDRATQKAA